MSDLKGQNVLLSASFPSGERGERFKPYDPSGIVDAVCAFSREILESNGTLTIGGHPTITPLVVRICKDLKVVNSVTVFQSEWFREQQLPEIDDIEGEQLGTVQWTEKAYDRDESLRIMREAMINEGQFVGALFIGGMEGIEAEYKLVRRVWSHTPCVPVAGPGGAAACLSTVNAAALGLSSLEQSRKYPYMAFRFVEALANTQTVAETYNAQAHKSRGIEL